MGKYKKLKNLFLVVLFTTGSSLGISNSELVEICEKNEKAIQDISVEYTWYNDPPYTIEDIAGTNGFIPKDRVDFLSTKYPFEKYSLYNEFYTIQDEFGATFEQMQQSAYNESVFKSFRHDFTSERLSGFITDGSKREQLLTLTPLGFSVLRFRLGPEKMYLSELLSREDFTLIDTEIQQINGFNVIKATALTEGERPFPFLNIYFSVDHGLVPVRYQYMNGPNIAYTVNIHSLEEIADGIWFPTKGTIEASNKEKIDVYEATGEITVNQGLEDDYFDIDFPPGTEVYDEIMDIQYLVDPTKEQAEKFAKNQELLAEYERKQALQDENGSDNQDDPKDAEPCCPSSADQEQSSEIDQKQPVQNRVNWMAWLTAFSFVGVALGFLIKRKKTAK